MPSTATARNRFEKQATGENFNIWGSKLNSSALDLIDESLDGVQTISLTGPKTLSSNNFVTDEARKRVTRFTGIGTFTITIPAVQKHYLFDNATSGTLTVTAGGSINVTIPPGICQWIYTDGSAVRGDSSGASAASASTSATSAAGSASSAAASAGSASSSAGAASASASAAASSAALAGSYATTAKALASTVTSSSFTYTPISDGANTLSFTPQSGKIYRVTALLIYSSAVTTTGIGVKLEDGIGGGSTTFGRCEIQYAAASQATRWFKFDNGTSGPLTASNAAAAGTHYVVILEATFVATSSPGTIDLKFNSTAGSGAVTVHAGSSIVYQKLN